MKKCVTCKQEKDSKNFSKDKSTFDGLTKRCKMCAKQSHRAKKLMRKCYFKGVYRSSKTTFIAKIYHNGVNVKLGNFKSEIEAAKAYNNYVITHNLKRKLNEV